MKPVEGMPTEAAEQESATVDVAAGATHVAREPEPEVVDGDVLREVDAPPIIDVEESSADAPGVFRRRASWPSPSNAEGCRRRETGEGEEASQGSRAPEEGAERRRRLSLPSERQQRSVGTHPGADGSSRLCTLTPSRRTGRAAASVRSSSATARCAMSSASLVGGSSSGCA